MTHTESKMSDIAKRPGAAETAAAAEHENFVLLTTARDNAEAAFIESILRGESVPYVTRPHSRESWSRVMMGFDFGGVDFFVTERLLDSAAELISPADGDGQNNADGDKGNV